MISRFLVGRSLVRCPFLVIRSRRPLLTRARYLKVSEDVMRVGVRLGIGDDDINLRTLLRAASRL